MKPPRPLTKASLWRGFGCCFYCRGFNYWRYGCFSGIIGFIGLMVPMLPAWWWAVIIAGFCLLLPNRGIFLLWSMIIARTILAPDLFIGIITGLVGGLSSFGC